MNKHPLKVIAGAPDKPLTIGNIEIQCYVLEDEQRVLSQRGLFGGIGVSRGSIRSGGRNMAISGMPRAIIPFLSKDLTAAVNSPIEFQPPGGGRTAYGYPAPVLVGLCEAVLKARDSGSIDRRRSIVQRCDMLLRGLATVGIIALVDEATGYQRIRSERALAEILEKFIAKELQEWTKTFPYEFYEQIFRLKRWQGPEGSTRPSVIGHYTNDIVYARLAPGVLQQLRHLNPTVPETGRRQHKHHQWFTAETGNPKLREHLIGVIALMRSSASWEEFMYRLQLSYPAINETLLFPLPFNTGATGTP